MTNSVFLLRDGILYGCFFWFLIFSISSMLSSSQNSKQNIREGIGNKMEDIVSL